MGEIEVIEMWTEPVGTVIPGIFGIYLLAVLGVTLVRDIRLALRLWSFRPVRVSLNDDSAASVEVIAEAALKGKIERVDKHLLTSKLQSVEARFLYLWEVNYGRVQSTKALAAMTLILVMCIACWGAFSNFGGQMFETNGRFVPAYWRDLFMLLCPGVFVSALLYASAFWFQGTLTRRRIHWNYARSKFIETLL